MGEDMLVREEGDSGAGMFARSSPDETAAWRESIAESATLRIAGAPLAAFAISWMLLLAIWLGWQFGFTWETRGTTAAPPPGAVPYHMYLPGGKLAGELTLDIAPGDLPIYDRSLQQRSSQYLVLPDERGARRLMTAQQRSGTIGWPSRIISFAAVTWWDVTDPTRPFRPVPRDLGFADPGFSTASRWFEFTSDAEGWRLGFRIVPGALLWPLAITQSAALVLVGGIAGFVAIRQRRRRRAGRCLRCGHQLDPAHPARRCPECAYVESSQPRLGADASTTGTMRHSVRVFLGLWLVLALAAGAAAAIWPEQTEVDVAERAAEQAQWYESYAVQENDFSPREVGMHIGDRRYGWPWPSVTVSTFRYHRFTPGEPLTVIDAGERMFRHERAGWMFPVHDAQTPSDYHHIHVFPRNILVTLMILEIIALALILFCSALRRGTQRVNAQR
jgi:hypothetical protein